jgi:hypothetical protein
VAVLSFVVSHLHDHSDNILGVLVYTCPAVFDLPRIRNAGLGSLKYLIPASNIKIDTYVVTYVMPETICNDLQSEYQTDTDGFRLTRDHTGLYISNRRSGGRPPLCS